MNNVVEEERRGYSWVPGKSWRQVQEEKHAPSTDNSLTFMGRLARELIRITDPRYITSLFSRNLYSVSFIYFSSFSSSFSRSTVYIEHSLAWYDIKTQNEVLNHKVFSAILETIGTPGLSGLDKLVSFFIVLELEALVHYIEKNIRNKTWITMFEDCDATLSSLDSAKGKN